MTTCMQSDMKHWPFTVTNQGGKPMLQAEYMGEQKTIGTRGNQLHGLDQDEGDS